MGVFNNWFKNFEWKCNWIQIDYENIWRWNIRTWRRCVDKNIQILLQNKKSREKKNSHNTIKISPTSNPLRTHINLNCQSITENRALFFILLFFPFSFVSKFQFFDFCKLNVLSHSFIYRKTKRNRVYKNATFFEIHYTILQYMVYVCDKQLL